MEATNNAFVLDLATDDNCDGSLKLILSHHFIFRQEFHGVDFAVGRVPDELNFSEGPSPNNFDHVKVCGFHPQSRHVLTYFAVWKSPKRSNE